MREPHQAVPAARQRPCGAGTWLHLHASRGSGGSQRDAPEQCRCLPRKWLWLRSSMLVSVLPARISGSLPAQKRSTNKSCVQPASALPAWTCPGRVQFALSLMLRRYVAATRQHATTWQKRTSPPILLCDMLSCSNRFNGPSGYVPGPQQLLLFCACGGCMRLRMQASGLGRVVHSCTAWIMDDTSTTELHLS